MRTGLLFILFIILSLIAPLTIPSVEAATVDINVVKEKLRNAEQYIKKLTTDMGDYAIVSEYPGLPVVAYARWKVWNLDLQFIPGFGRNYVIDPDIDRFVSASVDLIFQNETYDVWDYGYFANITVNYRFWFTDNYYPDLYGIIMVIRVSEIRYASVYGGYSKIVATVTYLHEGITDFENITVYIVGELAFKDPKVGDTWNITYYGEPDKVFPSMRFTIRHVGALAPLVMELVNKDNIPLYSKVWNFDNKVMSVVGESMMTDPYAEIFLKTKLGVHEKLHDDFWDAIIIENTSDGCITKQDILFDYVDKTLGWINTSYPHYPYESKVATTSKILYEFYLNGTELHVDITLLGIDFEVYVNTVHGGAAFLSVLYTADPFKDGDYDPLYYELTALHNLAIGNYTGAYYDYINHIITHWDGNGIYWQHQRGYSTVRLALAIIIGLRLYSLGYNVNISTIEDMVNILLQLQWNGTGYYAPDGENPILLVKPDHKGGFMVSYGEIGSYGFTPFRPSLVEDLIAWASMEAEYVGPIPTNAESTLLSMAALILYLQVHGCGIPRMQDYWGTGIHYEGVNIKTGELFHADVKAVAEMSSDLSVSEARFYAALPGTTPRTYYINVHIDYKYSYAIVSPPWVYGKVGLIVMVKAIRGDKTWSTTRYILYFDEPGSGSGEGETTVTLTLNLVDPGVYTIVVHFEAFAENWYGLATMDLYDSGYVTYTVTVTY